MIEVKIIEDSRAANTGTRLTTLQLTYPRFLLPELNTHRILAKSSSSSRAVPFSKLKEQVLNNPAKPVYWGSNKPGMQAGHEIVDTTTAMTCWKNAAIAAVNHAVQLHEMGLHKQIVNRLIEPFLLVDTVITGTEWDNFFHLRRHKDAQPEIQALAHAMYDTIHTSTPVILGPGLWHLPYVTYKERASLNLDEQQKCSVARCARVSYLNHDQSECTVSKDIELFNLLMTRPFNNGKGITLTADDPVHASPACHQGTPIGSYEDKGITHYDTNNNAWSECFKDWIQLRKTL